MTLRNRFFVVGALACLAAPFVSQAHAEPESTPVVYGDSSVTVKEVTSKIAQEATKQTTGMISGRISQAVSNATGNISAGSVPNVGVPSPNTSSLQNGGAGKAAGDQATRGGAWANVSNSWLSGSQAQADFSGTLQTVVAGADYMVLDNMLVGASLGYEHGNVSLKYNGGKLKANNIAFAPYAAYIINDVWSVDAAGGHAWVDYDLSRANGTVSGNTRGSRWFASTNINANVTRGPWQLGSSVGYLYTKEHTDEYTESDGSNADGVKFRLGQAHATFRSGYLFPTDWGNVNPFGSVRFEYDANKTAATAVDAVGTKGYDSRFGTTFSVGTNFIIGDNNLLTIEGSTTQFRDNLESYTISGTYRIKF
jgi:Autotransporter beta-domain.